MRNLRASAASADILLSGLYVIRRYRRSRGTFGQSSLSPSELNMLSHKQSLYSRQREPLSAIDFGHVPLLCNCIRSATDKMIGSTLDLLSSTLFFSFNSFASRSTSYPSSLQTLLSSNSPHDRMGAWVHVCMYVDLVILVSCYCALVYAQ